MPKHYRELLGEREFLEYALLRWQKLRKDLQEKLESGSNRWIRNRLKRRINQVSEEIKILRPHLKSLGSPGSDPVFPQGANRGKKSPRGRSAVMQPAPVPGAGAMGVPNSASRGWNTLKGGLQIPRPQTANVRFG